MTRKLSHSGVYCACLSTNRHEYMQGLGGDTILRSTLDINMQSIYSAIQPSTMEITDYA
jgi:hypothetical protein